MANCPLIRSRWEPGFSVGSTTDIWWAGAGFGGSITCKAGRGMFGIKKPGQCKLDMTVATLRLQQLEGGGASRAVDY